MTENVQLSGEVIKAAGAPADQTILGWASVTDDENGRVVDRQGDRIRQATLRKAVRDLFLDPESSLEVDLDHTGDLAGQIIGSLVIDDATAAALGLPGKKRGWLVEVYIPDAGLYRQLAANPGTGFSIAGTARREAAQ
jgi:hypothetical protein